MKFKRLSQARVGKRPLASGQHDLHSRGAFTLVEIMITTALMLMVIISGLSALTFLYQLSGRQADYSAMTAVVEGRLEAIRAATYNPPNSPFTASTVRLTNTASVALSKAGTNFMVPGTVISEIVPIAAGHRVTVTATFQTPKKTMSLSLETLVNAFAGGQQ